MKNSLPRFVFGKILELLMTLLIVTVISFLLMKLSPVDPAEAYAKEAMPWLVIRKRSLSDIVWGLTNRFLCSISTGGKGWFNLSLGIHS